MTYYKEVGKDFERKDSNQRSGNYENSEGDVESIGFIDKYSDQDQE